VHVCARACACAYKSARAHAHVDGWEAVHEYVL
jgi:hypothetical protein